MTDSSPLPSPPASPAESLLAKIMDALNSGGALFEDADHAGVVQEKIRGVLADELPASPLPWVDVRDRVPDTDRDVAIWRTFGGYQKAFYNPELGKWYASGAGDYCVDLEDGHSITHWLDVTPPTEQEG